METVNKQEIHIVPPEMLQKGLMAVFVGLTVMLVAFALVQFKQYEYVGEGVTASNTISVTGTGDIFSIPDIATFSVTILETAKDVASAQKVATAKSNDITDYLKGAGIESKDIQTTDYSVNPEYDWVQAACPNNTFCPPGKQVLRDYAVSETLTVKVRDTTKAGDILSAVGRKGASNVSGLTFTVDDEDTVKAQARDKAIADARAKAEVLSRSLGVTLVRVIGFTENVDQPPYPVMYAAKAMSMDSASGGAAAPVPAPSIEPGQNKVTSNVSVTYEIR